MSSISESRATHARAPCGSSGSTPILDGLPSHSTGRTSGWYLRRGEIDRHAMLVGDNQALAPDRDDGRLGLAHEHVNLPGASQCAVAGRRRHSGSRCTHHAA